MLFFDVTACFLYILQCIKMVKSLLVLFIIDIVKKNNKKNALQG